MNKSVVIIVVVLMVIVGGYFLLKGSYSPQAPTPTQAPIGLPEEVKTPTETLPTSQVPTPEVKEFTVAGTEFSFNPASINVKTGEKVKIIFKNNGRAPHNLIVEGLDVGTKTIGGGQQDTIEFTVPSSGTYTFFCSVPGHRASGMEGDLKIE